jgi:multisubunit Na+/H+ antiporter MnhF subunit
MKVLAILVFIAIVISLGLALYHLIKHPSGEDSAKTLKALTTRIGLSLVLFILIAIAYATGLFEAHGIGARIEQIRSEKNQPVQP